MSDQLIAFGGRDCCIKLYNSASKKVVNVLEGHTRTVMSIAISTNSSYIVSGSCDRTVRVWSVSEMQQLFVLTGHMKAVCSVAFSIDSKWIASASEDRQICVWRVADQSLNFRLTHSTAYAKVLAFTENSLFAGYSDGRIIEREIDPVQDTLQDSLILEANNWVFCIDISEGKTKIIAGLKNGKIKLWQKGIIFEEYTGHLRCANSVKFACKDQRIISASSDNTVAYGV
jgi:WD40 repeat protein